jgi:hypothetical protein
MASEEYIKRHDNVAKIIHQKLAYEYQPIKEKVPTFKYEPDSVWKIPGIELCGTAV